MLSAPLSILRLMGLLTRCVWKARYHTRDKAVSLHPSAEIGVLAMRSLALWAWELCPSRASISPLITLCRKRDVPSPVSLTMPAHKWVQGLGSWAIPQLLRCQRHSLPTLAVQSKNTTLITFNIAKKVHMSLINIQNKAALHWQHIRWTIKGLTREYAVFIPKQLCWGTKFRCFAMVHDQDLVCIYNGVQSVCNYDDRAGGELLVDGVLYEGICICVYRCCGLVQANYLQKVCEGGHVTWTYSAKKDVQSIVRQDIMVMALLQGSDRNFLIRRWPRICWVADVVDVVCFWSRPMLSNKQGLMSISCHLFQTLLCCSRDDRQNLRKDKFMIEKFANIWPAGFLLNMPWSPAWQKFALCKSPQEIQCEILHKINRALCVLGSQDASMISSLVLKCTLQF